MFVIIPLMIILAKLIKVVIYSGDTAGLLVSMDGVVFKLPLRKYQYSYSFENVNRNLEYRLVQLEKVT